MSEASLRVQRANELIHLINSSDPNPIMKNREGVEEYFELRDGKLWFIPHYGKPCLFEMKKKNEIPEAKPRHYHGSGVTDFIGRLASWIITGEPTHIFSRYWGYSKEALITIHHRAAEIGFIKDPSFKVWIYGEDREEVYDAKH